MRCRRKVMCRLAGLCVVAAVGCFPLTGMAGEPVAGEMLPADAAGPSIGVIETVDVPVDDADGQSERPAGIVEDGQVYAATDGAPDALEPEDLAGGGDECLLAEEGEGGAPAAGEGEHDIPIAKGDEEGIPSDSAAPSGNGESGGAIAEEGREAAEQVADGSADEVQNSLSVNELPALKEAAVEDGIDDAVPVPASTWGLSMDISDDNVRLGSPLTVSAHVSGSDAKNFTYNYVWNYQGTWQKWGSAVLDLGGQTKDASWTFTFDSPGRYQLFVDATAPDGTTHTVQRWIEVPDWSASLSLNASALTVGEELALEARVSGADLEGFTYNFVWNYEGAWQEWGSAALEAGAPVSSASWKFTLPYRGRYQVIMDAIDPSGSSKSYETWVTVSGDWALSNIEATKTRVGEPMTITAVTKGNTKNLRYKFVWEKDNWDQWGVIQDASASNTATWTPKVSGEVTIYVDVFDSPLDDAVTSTADVDIASEQWGYDAVEVSSNLIKLGESITITPTVSGETGWLSYKYVWEKDNWAEWGVISGPTAGKSSQGWRPTEPGDYTVYCDITGSDGVTRTKTATFAVWSAQGMNVEWLGGDGWRISADLGISNPGQYGFTYNYVWNFEGAWDWWGSTVLDTGKRTSESSWQFTPGRVGRYDVHIDVVGPDGAIASADSSLVRYSNAEYDMWQRVQQYSSTTQWLLACDTSSCVTGVYRKVDGHWEQVYRWACSPGAAGTPTVTGVFSVGIKGLYFDSYGSRQYYYTQFYGDYLFHSTTYYTNGSVMDNRLGLHLSHGCVRLATENAKWIYDNVPYGSTVVVY